jgi:hypothetical protein
MFQHGCKGVWFKKKVSKWMERGKIKKSILAWLERSVVNKVSFSMV